MVSISRGPVGPSRSRAQRDRTVGSRRSSWSAQSTIVTRGGGSSSVFRSAFWASSFICEAPSTMATRAPPSTGRKASRWRRSRTPGGFFGSSGSPMTTWPPAPSGPSRCRSGWFPVATSRQARQARQGRSERSGAMHRRPAARSSARVVLPTEAGPTRRTACGARPATIRATAPSATGWPRVAQREPPPGVDPGAVSVVTIGSGRAGATPPPARPSSGPWADASARQPRSERPQRLEPRP